MPARTNDFQELVALIERALAPKGAKVTPSAEVPVHGLQTLREVDVLIDGQFGPYKMKVAVEAKDHGRKISLQTFESLLAKYRGECRVNVDKFVIVSSRGFTEGVEEKAAATDVELLTIEQAKEKKWEAVGPRKMRFRVAPHLRGFSIAPPLPVVDIRFAYEHGKMICPKGHDHGTPVGIAKCIFFHQWLPHNGAKFREVEEQVLKQHKGQGKLTLTMDYHGWKVRLGGVDHPVETVTVDIHVVNAEGDVKHKSYQRRSSKGDTKVFHHIEGTAGNKKLDVLFGQGGLSPQQKAKIPAPFRDILPDRIVLKVDDVNKPAPGKHKRRARKKGG